MKSCPIEKKPYITQYRDLIWVMFVTREKAHEAIDVLEKSEELQDIPYDFADGMTLIVPADVLPFFDESNLQYKTGRLLNADDLSSEEYQRLREEQGTF